MPDWPARSVANDYRGGLFQQISTGRYPSSASGIGQAIKGIANDKEISETKLSIVLYFWKCGRRSNLQNTQNA
jgi:hypothetical protein